MQPTPLIGIINPHPTKPMITRILTRPHQIRRRSNRIIRRHLRRSTRHRFQRRHTHINSGTKRRYIRIIQIIRKFTPPTLGTIARRILETGFTSEESGTFFGFTRTAILTCGTVVIVPGLAAEEVVFGTVVPGDCVGGGG